MIRYKRGVPVKPLRLAFMFYVTQLTVLLFTWGRLLRRVSLLLFCGCCISGCADDDFFQRDARATPEEVAGNAPAGPDSVWVVAGRHYDRSGLHRFFWGDHNRAAWATPVKLPVFRLDSIDGGLTVEKKGGGFQTTSFTLQDRRGRLYAFRSIDKNPVTVVPPFWRRTFVANVLRDQTSAANPYGALVVPVLAEAVGVYHATPSLYYVPATDTSFGPYAKAVQGRVFLLQEKFETPADLTPQFGTVVDFADSEKALQHRYAHNSYRFDQHAFARARLLDLLIGDWDRHKGQWEWAVKKQGHEHLYIPIPKDRDQAFMKMDDGLIPAIATSKFGVRKFHSFDKDFDDVQAYMVNGSYLDARFLNELSLEEWQQIAQRMQRDLSDQVLEQAVRRLPKPIYELMGEKLLFSLKSRRDQLPAAAARMYLILAKDVTVAGTDEEEYFVVNRLNDAQTEVTVRRAGNYPATAKPFYHRIFNKSETEQITLYGLAGDDTLVVRGNVADGIRVNIYGGLGEDTIADSSAVAGPKNMTRIYDTARGNNLYFGTEARDMTTRDVRVHAYDREGN